MSKIYKTHYYSPKTGFRKIRKRKAQSTREIATKALSMAKTSAGPMGHHDVSISEAVDNTGVIVDLSNVAQGITEHTRRGEETRLLSSRLNLSINESVDSTIPTIIRIILFRNMLKESATVGGATTSVLESASTYSLTRQDNKASIIVLWDKLFTINKDISTGVLKSIAKNNIYVNLRNVKARYDGPNASDDTTGHLFLLLLSNQGTNTPTVNGRHRCYFRSV